MDSYQKGHPREGVIQSADNVVSTSTGTISLLGVLPNKDGVLVDGMRARVRVPASDPHEAMLITDRAIGSDQGIRYVFLVDKENRALRRDIQLGPMFDGLQVVNSGLTADDWVVVNGIQRVRDGVVVDPQKGAMPGAEEVDADKADAETSAPKDGEKP